MFDQGLPPPPRPRPPHGTGGRADRRRPGPRRAPCDRAERRRPCGALRQERLAVSANSARGRRRHGRALRERPEKEEPEHLAGALLSPNIQRGKARGEGGGALQRGGKGARLGGGRGQI